MATEIDIFQIGAKLTGHWSLVTGHWSAVQSTDFRNSKIKEGKQAEFLMSFPGL
jgi:hypothetical protein